jgi:hypothetical protein
MNFKIEWVNVNFVNCWKIKKALCSVSVDQTESLIFWEIKKTLLFSEDRPNKEPD